MIAMKKLLFISIDAILTVFLEGLTLSFAEVGQTQDLRNLSPKVHFYLGNYEGALAGAGVSILAKS
jgi:hypothetical protein